MGMTFLLAWFIWYAFAYLVTFFWLVAKIVRRSDD